MSAVLALQDATVRYEPGAPAQLDGVSLTVAAGEMVTLVGPNGAGKTTAVRALLGLVPLERGSATVLDRPIAAWPRDELARAVAALGQREEPAFPLPVAEAVAMGRYPYLGPWRGMGPADHAAIARAMARADVTPLASRWVQTLSGGEWQRVRLARALAQEPRALVLDEPTASLDVRHEMELFELVADLVRRDGLAAVVVTHHLNLAARFTGRLVLMAGGRVAAEGAPADVLRVELLSSVFDWPLAVRSLDDGAPQVHPERRPITTT